jgi:hypothetical protein
MNLFRRAWKRESPADYRAVTALIRWRRTKRHREPKQFQGGTEVALQQIRGYRPFERLAILENQTRQLLDDSKDIPRTWDPEETPPTGTWLPAFHFGLGLFLNVAFCAVLTCICIACFEQGNAASGFAVGGIVAALALGLLTWILRKEIEEAAHIGWLLAAAELGFFGWVIVGALAIGH